MNTQAPSPSPGPVPDNGASPGEHFFDRIRSFGVVRPDEGRWAAGVCAGLARRWGLDPLLVRGLFIVAGIASGFGLGLYGLLWLFLPHPDGRIHAQQVLRGVVTAGFVGSVAFVVIDVLGNGAWGWDRPGPPFGGLPFLVLVGLGIWWFVGRRNRPGHIGGPGQGEGHVDWGQSAPGTGTSSGTTGGTGPDGVAAALGAPAYGTPTPGAPRPGGPESETAVYPSAGAGYASGPAGYGYAPPPASGAPTMVATPPRPIDGHRPLHALTLTTLGTALVAAGGVLLWDRYVGTITDAGLVATAVALGVVALGVVLAGIIGRRSGGLAPIAIVLAIVAANGAAWQDSVDGVSETQNWTPATAAVATTGFELGAGRAVLDLTSTGLLSGATSTSPVTVPASLGAGELVVVLPRGVSSEVNASVGLGAITNRVGGQDERGGPGVKETITSGTNPVLVVDAKVGLGHIEVVPQGTEVTR